MSAVKISPSRQVVIPKHIYDELELTPGDYLEVTQLDGKVVFTPKTLVDKPRTARPGPDEDASQDSRRSDPRGRTRPTH
jgi:AbrB family looped-hinge helix DNA binding protein